MEAADITTVNSELMLFTPPMVNKGITNVSFSESRPVNSISDGIEISLKASGLQYLDLERCRLKVRFKITDSAGKDIKAGTKVAPVNLALHSFFKQCDVYLQHQLVSTSGNLYPYKSLFDVLLGYGQDAKRSHLQASMYYKDWPNRMDYPAEKKQLENPGWKYRFDATTGSKTVDLEGKLFLDAFNFSRYLLNEVLVSVRFFQSSDDFRLLSGEGVDKKFKVELLDVAILGCYVTLDPEVVKAHTKSLEKEKAIYPYTSTQMKSFAVPKGQFSASFGDIYSGKVPNNLVLGIVSAEAAAGSQQKNPFNFEHCDLESVTLYVNDQSIPFKPLEFNFDEDLYTAGYLSLFSLQHDIGCDVGLDIMLGDYDGGYCLIAFDIKAEVDGTEQSLPRYGNVKLDLRFRKALPEAVNVILYCGMDSVLYIDQARAVKIPE